MLSHLSRGVVRCVVCFRLLSTVATLVTASGLQSFVVVEKNARKVIGWTHVVVAGENFRLGRRLSPISYGGNSSSIWSESFQGYLQLLLVLVDSEWIPLLRIFGCKRVVQRCT